MTRTIVDTGPLVALLYDRDRHHEWAKEAFASLRRPLYTCEAVIVETTHILRRFSGRRDAALELLARKVLEIDFHLQAELLPLRSLIARYASVPMSVADACVVRMSELDPKASVLTTDSDFRFYRRGGRLVIPVIMPS